MNSPSELAEAAIVCTAPARVNLIGEHTDYTGGLVLPMAIPFQTSARIAPADDGGYRFASESFSGVRTMAVDDRSAKAGNWSDYSVGVLRELQERGLQPPPFRMSLSGNVPLGSGLSSSASVEVATAMALLAWTDARLSVAEIAQLCQRAENRYVRSPCGIMDQFVITAATAGHALLLHTRDLTFELLPMDRGDLAACAVVVVNSGIRHSVADGVYGTRRREVEAGQKAVLARFPELRDLGDASLEQLAACESDMPPESFRRCRHIVTENARVREAREALLAGRPERLGELMTLAHASYRDDFAASVAEVDFLVDTALATPGCFGSRLTGGGFGGCTVNLVRATEAQAFSAALRDAYRQRFALEAETYICQAVDGAASRKPVRAN